MVTVALPHHFLVPTQNWRDKIQKVLDHPTPIYLKVGTKKSSFRRRLILASCQPSFYTNFVNNKLKVQEDDRKNEGNTFVNEMKRRDVEDPSRKLLYGFFHPYANNGGGGERVLWEAVKATLLEDDRNIVVVYISSDQEPLQIIRKAEEKFQINLDSPRVVFIYLRRFSKFIDGNYWKHFTMIGQLLGTFLLTLEAMNELSPDVWIDTMGLPCSYFPVHVILKIPILAYIHYPIIQKEMFNKLKYKSIRQVKFTKDPADILQVGKLMYWSGLYYFYTYLGSLVDVVLTNGTWTYSHISEIFTVNTLTGSTIDTLYPPCGEGLTSTKGLDTVRENKMLYIGQFRPEKRHNLILEEYLDFLAQAKSKKLAIAKLPTIVFLGSCRTPDDTATLSALYKQVEELELTAYVEFVVDCSYDEVVHWLSKATYGLNAMWNEHFGIGVVEYLSSGIIPLVHASAGPYLDIVTPWNDEPSKSWYNNTGFFFKSKQDPDFDPIIQVEDENMLNFKAGDSIIAYPTFAKLLSEIFIEHPQLVAPPELESMRSNGEKVVEKFSNRAFDIKWMQYLKTLSSLESRYRDEKRSTVERVY